MNHPNIHIPFHTGSKNYIYPITLKASFWVRIWSRLFQFIPEPKIVYNIYIKNVFWGHSEVKKGDVYLDKSSCIKLVVLKVHLYPKATRTIQFCTLLPVNEKEKNKINFPMLLKYIGTTK
jgi:hypothetical protein